MCPPGRYVRHPTGRSRTGPGPRDNHGPRRRGIRDPHVGPSGRCTGGPTGESRHGLGLRNPNVARRPTGRSRYHRLRPRNHRARLRAGGVRRPCPGSAGRVRPAGPAHGGGFPSRWRGDQSGCRTGRGRRSGGGRGGPYPRRSGGREGSGRAAGQGVCSAGGGEARRSVRRCRACRVGRTHARAADARRVRFRRVAGAGTHRRPRRKRAAAEAVSRRGVKVRCWAA